MEKTTYTSLKAQLKEYVPGLKHVGLWNNQLEYWRKKDNGEYVFPLPAIFIELPEGAQSDQIGGGLNMIDPYDINFHIIHEKLNEPDLDDDDLEQEENFEVFTFKKDTYTALQWFRFPGSGPMNKIVDTADHDHDNLYHYIQGYRTTWIEDTNKTPREGYEQDPPFTWEKTIDVKKENE